VDGLRVRGVGVDIAAKVVGQIFHRGKDSASNHVALDLAKPDLIVGLYLNPPEHALVLSVDEKSQIQALDRTQPGLPMKKGRGQTMTPDYKRNGTTTLFAALNTATGEVYGLCQQRHRHHEWLKFLRLIDETVLAQKQITSSATITPCTSIPGCSILTSHSGFIQSSGWRIGWLRIISGTLGSGLRRSQRET
jgi:hypothetical protein